MQKIIVAESVEIRDFQGGGLLQFLNSNADPGKLPSVWTYPKGAGAKAAFEVTVVYTMAEFKAALDAADAYVIYEGHSRYGQGPAFAPANTPEMPDAKTFPVNPWGVHFKMGYDATDTECIDDIMKHSVKPAEYGLVATPSAAFLPEELIGAAKKAKEVQASLKKAKKSRKSLCKTTGAWRLFDDCHPKKAAEITARGDQPLLGRHFYRELNKGHEFFTAVKVGSADLNLSSLKCKVLFMASCSSHVHFFKPLDKRRKAIKSGCLFYMTMLVCASNHAITFIGQVFKGHDPASAKGKKAILKALNGEKDSGIVGVY